MLLGDIEGALESLEWFSRTFPDDIGDPCQYLCWSLAYYRSGNITEAKRKLLQLIFMNLYILPYLIGVKQNEFDIWHGSNWESKDYLDYIPDEILKLWNEGEIKWAEEVYHSNQYRDIQKKHIEINKKLKHESNIQNSVN